MTKGSAAFNRFAQKSVATHLTFFPVRLGYEHFLYSDNLFAFAEAGIANFKTSGRIHPGLSVAGGAGYKINMPKATLLQLSIFYNYNRYQSLIKANWITLRAAYGVKFGKRKAFKRDE